MYDETQKLHAKLQWAAFGVGVCHQLLRLLRDGFAYIYLILLFADGDLTSEILCFISLQFQAFLTH